jgi:hypothetical protein
MNFFVIGLPRSRTAWLAAFLTYEKHCFHEGLDGCQNIDEYKKKLGPDHGDSSTGLMLLNMDDEFPLAPKVIIESDPVKAADYAYKTYGFYDPRYILYLDDRLKLISGMRIHVDEIDQQLPAIWRHLIGTPFNEQRADLFKRMRIQVKDPHNYDKTSMQHLWNSLN